MQYLSGASIEGLEKFKVFIGPLEYIKNEIWNLIKFDAIKLWWYQLFEKHHFHKINSWDPISQLSKPGVEMSYKSRKTILTMSQT